jgi:hypothetical protein
MDHNGQTLSILEEIPEITWTFKRSDIGSASWTVPLSHPNVERVTSNDPLLYGVQPAGFGPKLTDYRIGVSEDNGVIWRTVHAGLCSSVEIDTTKDSISVAGVDWLAWLDQPYRFAGYAQDWLTQTPIANDIIKTWVNGENASVIADGLIQNLCNGPVAECVQITTSFTGTDWATDYVTWFMLGETDSVLAKLKGISNYIEPDGYEFYMGWDKLLSFYSPRMYLGYPALMVESVSLATFSPSNNNLLSVKWNNNGPIATTTVGMPPAFPAWKGYSTHDASKVVYRDWWQIKSIGSEAKSQAVTNKLTHAYAAHDRNPQKDITITFQPESVNPGLPTRFFDNLCGNIIQVDSEDWFLPYHRINAYYWIKEQTLACDAVGNWTCTCVLEQIY